VRLLVVGAGGHAKVVVDAACDAGWEIAGIIGGENDPATVLCHDVVHRLEDVADPDAFIIAVGDNATRARLFAEYRDQGLAPASVIHPSTTIGSDVEIGAGTLLAPGVIINTGARIGENVILNTGCSVDHDVIIGDHAHIGPRVALCGAVKIGEGALLGVGSCAAPLASVGAWTVVGAGAAVVGELPADSVCVGVPAKVTRSKTEQPT
jgi:sugar O-acyltransferase (sialic acid O-acetyltransferase NeuD family)